MIEKQIAGRFLRIRFENKNEARISEVVITGLQDLR